MNHKSTEDVESMLYNETSLKIEYERSYLEFELKEKLPGLVRPLPVMKLSTHITKYMDTLTFNFAQSINPK